MEIGRPVLDAQHHEFSLVVPPEDIWLEVDAVRLAQAIGNLLHNAAKFTPQHGRIGLTAERRAGELVITVEDNGVGIAPEIMPSVFDLFTQGERSLDRAQGGLGIGLSLVKGLVEMHGGRVTAREPRRGRGQHVHHRAAARAPRGVRRRSCAAAARPSTHDARRILVVEDNADAAESMRMLLDGIGHQVTVVNDGSAAVAAARAFRPDVVLLDIGLPGMDGFEIASALRALPETSRAHLIAVSGYGQDKDRALSAQAGFDLHLVKPVDPSRLAEAIDAAD